MNTGRRTLALLGSLCLFLSAVEYLIPKPLPFMRIGLANLPLLLALTVFDAKDFFLLALLKVLGQGIIGGTFFSYVFLFSLAGTFASAALMYGLRGLAKKKLIGCAGLGCAGAMASNAVQLVLARYLIFGPALRYLIPPFLASGLVSGLALGLFCEYFCRHSQWMGNRERALDDDGASGALRDSSNNDTHSPHKRWNASFNADELCIAALLMALIFLFSRSLPARAAQFLFFFLLASFSGKKNNPLITIMIMAGIVFCNVLAPYGKVLLTLGPLRITQGSLLSGIENALTLEGLLMLSRACIKSDLKLPGTIGSLLGESLRILELLRERKGLIRRGRIIAGIDRLMLEMETAEVTMAEHAPCSKKRSIKRIMFLSIMVVLTATFGLVL